MMDYSEVGNYSLKLDRRVLDIMLDRACKPYVTVTTINLNLIEDVEYEELAPDPNDGPAPTATLVACKPKK